MRGVTIWQPFHGGVIALDAVEHSWAWTGDITYETFDVELQATLTALSRTHSLLLDIGCNVGAMSLAVLLENPRARVVAVDPNRRATDLLRRSLARNNLVERATVVVAAVAPTAGSVSFDENGSVTGHVATVGRRVEALGFERLLRDSARGVDGLLVKLDVEGFERDLLQNAAWLRESPNLALVIEVHPLGFNGVGNPAEVFAQLRMTAARIRDLSAGEITHFEPNAVCLALVDWPDVK